MVLNNVDQYFLKDPERMRMGKGKLSERLNCTEQKIVESRQKVRKILAATSVVNKLSSHSTPTKLYFDIEVSPNIVFSWGIGRNIFLGHDAIIKERAIICICWKWEGSTKVHSLEWDKGCDKQMLKKFAKVLNSADEIITQNGDAFDVKWVRGRCLLHDIAMPIKFNSIDTLKMARAGYRLNCNKLDYIGQFLGIGQKNHTSYQMWKDITLDNCQNAMDKMVKYCKQDVVLLEKVYKKLQPFSPEKKFKYK